ncbi:helix-turn-helix domain-containing protein [Clostridium sp.]|uniref:helix-turn-helix domain-containing protein n=1 Tax=Clostridium sp. TaxID=1506 RepID=UPI003F3DC47F
MRVKEFREKKGYTQQDIAIILGIKQGSYSDKENERRPFTVKELLILEILLDVSISDMYKDTKEEIKNKLNRG